MYLKDHPTPEVLMFYQRYYSLFFDKMRLLEVYNKILVSDLTPAEWANCILLAKLSGHEAYRKLIAQASRLYPDLADRFAELVK